MKIPDAPPSLEEAWRAIDPKDLLKVLAGAGPVDYKGRYLHWDEMRNRQPPEGLSRLEWWVATNYARRSSAKTLPARAVDGTHFRFSNIDLIQEMVHRIDQQASGQILSNDVTTNLRSSDRYLVSSLIEEAITSSQLEGASTTRAVAKAMLATGRRPHDKSEQMIFNNYQGMLYAREMASRELTIDDVLELHRILTIDTLEHPENAGRMQGPNEKRVAVYWHDDTLLHSPPDASELPERMKELCRFANGKDSSGFIHPVVRSIIVHFCLAYDHPFEDGNGRTSRALFYWSMLNEGYWLTQYLSISSILRNAPVKYAKSYLYTETDDSDLTYFIIYQLEVIERAIASLHEYLARKLAETRSIEAKINNSSRLNNRQLLIIGDALRDPAEPFTFRAQARRNRVTYQTARTDLLELEQLGLFTRRTVSGKFVYRAVPDLPERLKSL